MPHLLARLFAVHLLVLEGTGALERLRAMRLPVAPDARAFALTVAGASLLLLLWSALAAGPDPRVRSFRAGTLVAALALPAGALAVVSAGRPAYGGAALLAVLAAALLHAALAKRRRESAAARALGWSRLVCESVGLALFLWGAALLVQGETVPLRLAFWSLFLLRMSVADLLRPSTLVSESGLPRSAVADLKHAAGAGRRKRTPRLSSRASRALKGAAKGAAAALWLALPFLAAIAPAAVSRGLWPQESLALRAYPPLALGATAALLLLKSARSLPSAPLGGVRGGVVAVASLLYLLHAYRDPAFAGYRVHLPGIVLCEALFGFVLGTAASRGSR